ncbi:uncharacterized protein LOC123695391 isoform X2 [Colias croceus]|uniref:uncharacterized protein LOC123695391 isoform X2 n=1 Tax=Colias crocea TaxID=72248 RepID=UPI001E27D429|nr:uncharacterized protein LOC123695391 isoform X2 [Colias croceus]
MKELRLKNTRAGYNVSGERRGASSLKVFAMWYTWITLLLVCALVQANVPGEAGPATEVTGQVVDVTGRVADEAGPLENVARSNEDTTGKLANADAVKTEETTNVPDLAAKAGPVGLDINPVTEVPIPVATTRAQPRTLDRQAAELAWRTWLQSPESGNPNGPPRRITTKSLFITPLVCSKGQRLDRNGCVQTVTVNKDEHERILLEQLNALFMNSTPSNNGDVLYDYGEEEPGPLQLSIPIGLDPSTQNRDTNPLNIDKKEENMLNDASSIEAELELLKLQQAQGRLNDTGADNTNILSHNVLNNLLYSDKPKRDSPMVNSNETSSQELPDDGQKELVYGHVNVDPVLYDTDSQNEDSNISNQPIKKDSSDTVNGTAVDAHNETKISDEQMSMPSLSSKDEDETKLNPENDYSDIGEAIKLISRYAEVSTDDNFSKNDNKFRNSDDSILGTRTKLQYRRNKLKDSVILKDVPSNSPASDSLLVQTSLHGRPGVLYRYPNENVSPPANYPFKRLQDYWPGRNQVGGVYNNIHQNPKRHHHSYPHYFRPRGYPVDYPDVHSRIVYPGFQHYPHKILQHSASPVRSQYNDQDIYSLLGLRHWFSSEGASKR